MAKLQKACLLQAEVLNTNVTYEALSRSYSLPHHNYTAFCTIFAFPTSLFITSHTTTTKNIHNAKMTLRDFSFPTQSRTCHGHACLSTSPKLRTRLVLEERQVRLRGNASNGVNFVHPRQANRAICINQSGQPVGTYDCKPRTPGQRSSLPGYTKLPLVSVVALEVTLSGFFLIIITTVTSACLLSNGVPLVHHAFFVTSLSNTLQRSSTFRGI